MNQEREIERHNLILERIANATDISELPDIGPGTLSKFFSDNVYFNGNHISSREFANLYDCIKQYGLEAEEFKKMFINILKINYPSNTNEEYEEKYDYIINHPRVPLLLDEIDKRDIKIVEFNKNIEKEEHKKVMDAINGSFELSELPKVSKANITEFITSPSRVENESLKAADVANLVVDLLDGLDPHSTEFKDQLYDVCEENMDVYYLYAFEKICDKLRTSDKLDYLIEETKAKEERILKIYDMDHTRTMDKIEDATRISELPQGITISKLTGYFSGNTIIYPKTPAISSTEFADIAEEFLKGATWESEDVQYMLKAIAQQYYPEKADEAYSLLYYKLKSLPKTKYIVDEINYGQSRQKEFIQRGASNVNIYLIPNPNTPESGGLFYNCYINRAQNLDLQELLPLNLTEIIPEGMDVDSIEWYVQKHFDPTFKTAGGIILNKDERIGNANIFKPNDTDKVDITIEEKSRYEELEELSTQVKNIISKKREETRRFEELQKSYIESQKATDEELSLLEAKIDALTNNIGGNGNDGKQKNLYE